MPGLLGYLKALGLDSSAQRKTELAQFRENAGERGTLRWFDDQMRARGL